MSAPAPKGYQRDAVVNAPEVFGHAESQLTQAGDDASRAAATAFNSCLLETPTGCGKTLMTGMIVESFASPDRASNAKIVWFWFKRAQRAGPDFSDLKSAGVLNQPRFLCY